MKKLILSSFILLFIFSCTNEIHEIESNTLESSLFDKEFVDFASFKDALSKNSIQLHDAENILAQLQSEFTSRNSQIHSFRVSKELEGIGIIASDVTKEQNTSIWLKSNKNEGDLYRAPGGSTTCTCTGCPNGCNPKRKANGDCICTRCVSGGTKCTKTESLEIKELNNTIDN